MGYKYPDLSKKRHFPAGMGKKSTDITSYNQTILFIGLILVVVILLYLTHQTCYECYKGDKDNSISVCKEDLNESDFNIRVNSYRVRGYHCE